MSNNVLLIGGTGRSGTSILNRILSNHPEITNVPEWRFLIDPDGIVDFYQNAQCWSPYHYDIKLKRLEKLLRTVGKSNFFSLFYNKLVKKLRLARKFPIKITTRYAGMNISKSCPGFNENVQELISNLEQFSFKGSWVGMPFGHYEMKYNHFVEKFEMAEHLTRFLDSVIDSVKQNQGSSYYLEKNTWNILWFDAIRELLPSAKLVHIYRDPRDVVASYTKQTWMPSDPVQSAIIYRDLMNRWWKVRENVPEDSFLELRLEYLVRETKNALSQVCDFWEVPWNDKLLDIKLNRSHSGRWKQDLSKNQQKEVQKVLQDQLKALGYWEI